MTVYFDTSALLKLVVEEDGSETAAALWDGADAVVTSRLAYPEGRAALAAARRMGRLTAPCLGAAKLAFASLWRQLWLLELTDRIAFLAGDLAEQRSLRGYDAVHLASAMSAFGGEFVLATWDRDLASAALALGFAVAPPA